MTEVDLSSLSGPELRGLLDTARARGQAAQSYEILQEMAARRDPGAAPARRVVSMDLGDPMAARDEPEPINDDAPLYLVTEPRVRRPEPKSVWEAAPEPPPKLQGLPRPPRPSLRTAVGFVAGAAVGLAGGLAVAALDLGQQAPAAPIAPPADFVQVAALTPPPQPVIPPPPVAEPEAAPAEEAPAAEAEAPPPEPEPEAAPVAVAEAEPLPEPPKVPKACAGKAKPADRTICADPKLKQLQHELRLAYGEALAVHEDRDLLRERQLAWADARDTVDDPERLARLYEQRIRKLNAAARAARESDETPKRRATRG